MKKTVKNTIIGAGALVAVGVIVAAAVLYFEIPQHKPVLAPETETGYTDSSEDVTSDPLSSTPSASSEVSSEPSSQPQTSTEETPSFTEESSEEDLSTYESSQDTWSDTYFSSETSVAPEPEDSYEESVPEGRIVDYTTPESYDRLVSHMAALEQQYPDIISVSDIGTTQQGRAIKMFKLGKGERKACIVGGMHAREHITVSYIMRTVEEYAMAYYSEDGMYDDFYSMKQLLDWYTLYIVPNCNPDGTEAVITGGDVQFESYKPFNMSQLKSNIGGVDLNRNFPFLWDDINNNIPSYNTYNFKGYSAGSELETQALMNLCEQNDFYFMLSFHIQGDCVYWRDTYNGAVPEDIALVNRLAYICGFKICDVSSQVNSFGGGFENWFRYRFNKPGMCVELVDVYTDIYPTSDYNHRHFEETLDYSVKKYAIIAAMYEYNQGEAVLEKN